MKNETNKPLKRTEYIDMDGNRRTGLSKNAHAREMQRLRGNGYTFEQIQTITGVKSY